MAHNLEQYQNVLLHSPSYAAAPSFLSHVGWQMEDSGHILVEKESNMNFVVSIVALVSDYCYFVGPNGNYSSNQFCDFSSAKFLFHLVVPEGTPLLMLTLKFAYMWWKAFKHKLQPLLSACILLLKTRKKFSSNLHIMFLLNRWVFSMSFCSSTLMTFSRITLLKVAHSGDLFYHNLLICVS